MNTKDALDQKLNEVFEGKVVRKDLLHRIKKGTNVPTFVLEFLLAKYCASNDQAEMDAGMEAVLSSLQENYVRPDEANAAQLVCQANLETLNAHFIHQGLAQTERLTLLNQTAIVQMKLLLADVGVQRLQGKRP